MKISVVTPRFAISGVPLGQIRFARALARAGHDVELVIGCVNPGCHLPSFSDVKVTVLSQGRVIRMMGFLLSHLRDRRPDVVFTAEDHLNAVTLFAAMLCRSGAKISCSSRVTPFDTYSNVPFTKRWFLRGVMRMAMRRADALTCVSEDMVEQYKTVFGPTRHVCVYNIVGDASAPDRINEPVDEPWFIDGGAPVLVAAGSLAPWKGFDDLIRALAELRRTREARLIILGDGPVRRNLEDLVRGLGLVAVVKLPGYVENPLKYFSRANVFVLSSHVEGLPNVLVEAMMCGCTPVATDCPTGPREVLHSGKYGYLVPMKDPAAMAAAIATALENPIARERLLEAVQPFTEERVLARHFDALGMRETAAGASSLPSA